MKLSIEKRPSLAMNETFFVFTHGEQKWEIESNAAKSILLLWVFFATVFFTYVVGMQTANQSNMMTAYLAQGNLTDEDGNPVACKPIMTEERSIEWNCTVQKLVRG